MTDETTTTDTTSSTTDQTAADATATTTDTTGTTATDDSTDTTILSAATDDSKGADDTTATTDDKPAVPDTYDLKLVTQNEAGEDVEQPLDPVLVEAATPLLKEVGLNSDQANKLLPLVPKVQEQIIKQQTDAHAARVADWEKETKADPEIGGANFKETQRLAAKALDHFTGPAVVKNADGSEAPNQFRKLLEDSGLGNHPVMVRTFRDIGKALSEDQSFVRNNTEQQVKKSREEINYPNDVPKTS